MALCITRKVGQAVILNNNIEVRVLRAEDGKITLGITAPREVPIHREEWALNQRGGSQGEGSPSIGSEQGSAAA